MEKIVIRRPWGDIDIARTVMPRCAMVVIVLLGVLSCQMDKRVDPALEEQAILREGFSTPPNAARPRVWWHWLNANISEAGIRKDLDWMARIGLGGLQNFDVNFAVPTVVDERIPYMSDRWQQIYRETVLHANALGLEFGIAASPGWSETGGPWVAPEDGMKKLVWSTRWIDSRDDFDGVIAPPPQVTGPYQDLEPPMELNPTPKAEDPVLYRDVAVLAFPVDRPQSDPPPVYSVRGEVIDDTAALHDGLFGAGIDFPPPSIEQPTLIEMTFEQPQTVRSATLFAPNMADIYSGSRIEARLEVLRKDASAGQAQWSEVSRFELSLVPATISFPPVTATDFRVVVRPAEGLASNSTGAAPGYDDSIMQAMIARFYANAKMAVNELRLSSQAQVHQFETKAGYSVSRDYFALDNPADADVAVRASEVLDLSEHLQSDGRLDWTPPAGQWQLVRFGWSLLGKTNHPAVAEATGLEVDKLDAGAVRRYLETYLDRYAEAIGEELIGPSGISALLTDSTEVGAFNWTPGLLATFEERRGYDPKPWLPTLTGVIVDSREASDRFLYDYRQTISELHARAHYGTIAAVAQDRGLTVYGESLEGWRPSLGDDLGMRRFTDIPMAAVWSYAADVGPKPIYLADMRGAASVAHLYGQNLAAAESMTSTRHPWYHVPANLRRVVDLEFLHGINRVVIHSSVHQPLDDNAPGLSLRHIGQFFNRHTAWAEMAGAWIDYIARSSFLLQQGRFVADVAYFYGEEGPLGAQNWDAYLADVPKHYGYDFINRDALLNALTVENGELVSTGGARYRVLYLGQHSARMSLAVLRQIAALVDAGATVVGARPIGPPGLADDEAEYAELADRLWPLEDSSSQSAVLTGVSVESVLQSRGSPPDFRVLEPDADIQFVHRQLAHGDLYFVSNRQDRSWQVTAQFRVAGKKPYRWDAVTGDITPMSYTMADAEVQVPLIFAPEESFFVVLLEPTAIAEYEHPQAVDVELATIQGPWQVAFQSGRGAPAALQMDSLEALNLSQDLGVKYFSGVSRYSTTFSLAPGVDGARENQPILIDLGRVGDVAEVWINGVKQTTLWQAPFVTDISSAVVIGENALEVRVANRWVNRLIGDAQSGQAPIGYTVTPMYRADAPLLDAGLIGPVRLFLREQSGSP
jgi:hypothetical protein